MLLIWVWSFELLGIKYEVLGLRFWLIELVVCSSQITVLCSKYGLHSGQLGFNMVLRWWLGSESDSLISYVLLTLSSINVSSIWAAFNLSLVSATAFNVSASSNSCLLFITFNFLLACSSIWSANILAFSVSPRDFRWISAKCYMNWVKTYNFLMSIYISRNLLVTLFLNLDVSKKWLIALFCDLARDVLSIFSRNDLQKSNVFTGFLTS